MCANSLLLLLYLQVPVVCTYELYSDLGSHCTEISSDAGERGGARESLIQIAKKILVRTYVRVLIIYSIFLQAFCRIRMIFYQTYVLHDYCAIKREPEANLLRCERKVLLVGR